MSKPAIVLLCLGVLLVTNLICFCLMGADKSKARRGEWRISEKGLFLSAACFGALGGLLGMKHFRHKTKHWYFRVGFTILLILQAALLAALAWRLFRG